MFPWTRPPPHSDFQNDARSLLNDLQKDIADNPIDFKNRDIWSGGWSRRGQPPGLHKWALVGSVAESAKCIWCERIRDVSRELDVEHYRPKGKVTRWNGRPSHEVTEPPEEITVSATGYHWLAFSWPNYALSCKACNQKWKRNLFPVEEPRLACVAGVENTEKTLLIEPGSLFRTADHFAWDKTGIINPRSEQGYSTIVTCGLNRLGLVNRRLKTITETLECLELLNGAFRKGNDLDAEQQLVRLGRLGDRGAEFTSMVRWFAEKHLADPWEDFPLLPP